MLVRSKGGELAAPTHSSAPILRRKFAVLRNKPLCGDSTPSSWECLFGSVAPLRHLLQRGGGGCALQSSEPFAGRCLLWQPAKSLRGIRGSLDWCALPDTQMAKVELHALR